MIEKRIDSHQKRSHSVLDIFAAPGGMSAGFKEAGYNIIAAVDNDYWGCQTLDHNFAGNGTLIIRGNVQDIGLHGKVDVVVGGPPCQSFSIAGQAKIRHLKNKNKRDRFIDDEKNRLYKYFVRAVRAIRPQFFVMENVPAIESFDEGRICGQVIDDFKLIGYETDEKTINSADFGVPQNRRRAVFIGNRVGLENPFPIPHYSKRDSGEADFSILGQKYPNRHRTVYDAISDLPPLKAGSGIDEMDYPTTSLLTEYQDWARKGSAKLYNHVARYHSERDRKAFALLDPGQKMIDLPKNSVPYRRDIFKDKIKKQRWDQPSSAIVAHMQKDGLMYVHPDRDQARTFTPREAARIQSFRDKFRILGPLTQQFRQIGNAVPPLAAQAIAESIHQLLVPMRDPRVTYEVALYPVSRLPS